MNKEYPYIKINVRHRSGAKHVVMDDQVTVIDPTTGQEIDISTCVHGHTIHSGIGEARTATLEVYLGVVCGETTTADVFGKGSPPKPPKPAEPTRA